MREFDEFVYQLRSAAHVLSITYKCYLFAIKMHVEDYSQLIQLNL